MMNLFSLLSRWTSLLDTSFLSGLCMFLAPNVGVVWQDDYRQFLKQFFGILVRFQKATDSWSLNIVFVGYKTLQYIQKYPVSFTVNREVVLTTMGYSEDPTPTSITILVQSQKTTSACATWRSLTQVQIFSPYSLASPNPIVVIRKTRRLRFASRRIKLLRYVVRIAFYSDP